MSFPTWLRCACKINELVDWEPLSYVLCNMNGSLVSHLACSLGGLHYLELVGVQGIPSCLIDGYLDLGRFKYAGYKNGIQCHKKLAYTKCRLLWHVLLR